MQKVSEKINDETPFAITLKPLTSLENHTGAWRTLKPAYNFHEPPCSATRRGTLPRLAVPRGGWRLRGRVAEDHGR